MKKRNLKGIFYVLDLSKKFGVLNIIFGLLSREHENSVQRT